VIPLSRKTEIHDKMIKETVRWAKSLGYYVVDHNLGTETGADAIIENHKGERVILEVVTGHNFKKLFQKPRIKEIFEPYEPPLARLIIVTDRAELITKHGVSAGLPEDYFEVGGQLQRVFPVLEVDFYKITPVLLVSILGARAAATWG